MLAILGAREIVAAKNRNLPLVAMVLLFGVANALDHAGAMGAIADADLGIRAGIVLVVLMICVIGGRIVPSFTRNWMTGRGIAGGLPSTPGKFDLAVLATTVFASLAWVAAPAARAAGVLLLFAAVLQMARLLRWRGWRTVSDPLVLVLHVGYLWVPVGLALLGASIMEWTVPRSAALHALTAGAMGTMILAVMTRATLGHTGRALRADLPTTLLYVLITLGAVLRVVASFGAIDYRAGIEGAGLLWAAAFALLLLRYGPMLARERADHALG